MGNRQNRAEIREEKFISSAKKGAMSCEVALFKTEEKDIKKNDGMDVKRYNPAAKKASLSLVSWGNAFKGAVPLLVYDYISGKTQIFPDSLVHNQAQKLYVIAARVNLEKSTTEN